MSDSLILAPTPAAPHSAHPASPPTLAASVELCTFCPRLCSHTCPVSLVSARETLTPQAKMASLGLLQKNPEGEPAPALTNPLYGCTGCGACTTACLHHVEPGSLLMRGRAIAVHSGVADPQLADLPARQRQRAHEAGQQVRTDPALAGRFATPGQVALLPTCLPPRQANDAQPAGGPASEAHATLRVLDRLRAAGAELPPVGIAALPHGCGGYALYAGGHLESFRLYAESLAREIEEFDTLLLSCAACTWLLRTQYPEHGVPVRPVIKHVSEFLAPYAAALPVTRPLPRATYHDPCHLGRRLDCYEPPRQLLARVAGQMDEFWHHHAESKCCGSGGLLPQTEPRLAAAIATERRDDRDAEAAASPIVSACPACQRHLGSELGSDVRSLIEVLDAATTP